MRGVVLTVFLLGCSADPPAGPVIWLENPQEHWDDYAQMVPPTHLPQPGPGPAAVTVQVWIPEGASLAVVPASDGRFVLSWPPGTVADRVETRGDRVVDVRGMEIDAEGKRWNHVFRPTQLDPAAPLAGARWPAGDTAAGDVAVDAFLSVLAAGPIVGAAPDPEAWIAAVRGKLDCDSCHVVDRPANKVGGEHGLVARGTDTAGWFTPSSVLADSLPTEPYGAYDQNLADPFVRITCEGGSAELPAAGAGHARCPGGQVPTASLDLRAALLAKDAHAVAHCRSWRTLVDRLPGPDQVLRADHPCAQDAP